MAAASSAFVLSKVRYNVSLSPCHIAEPRVGIEQEMTSLLMRYSEPLRGVVLAFSNVRLAKPLGHIINEMPYIHCKVLADALVFQPREGAMLKGAVNKIGSNHIGMLFAGVFNGSVAASELPKGFVHNYAQDAWLDAKGNRIAVGDTVEVKVLRVHVAGGMIAIEASMCGFKGVAASAAAPVTTKAVAKTTKVAKAAKDVKASKPLKAAKTVESEPTPTKKAKKSKKASDADVAPAATKPKKSKKVSEAETVVSSSSKPSKKRKSSEGATVAAPVVEEAKKSKKKKSKKD